MPDTPDDHKPGHPRYRGPVNHWPYTLSELRQQLLEAQKQGLAPEDIKKIEADIAQLSGST